MFAMRRRLLVGIDIGTHSIKVVRLKQKGKGYQLLNFGIMPLRPDTMIDGNIANADAIVGAVRNLMQMERIKAAIPAEPPSLRITGSAALAFRKH